MNPRFIPCVAAKYHWNFGTKGERTKMGRQEPVRKSVKEVESGTTDTETSHQLSSEVSASIHVALMDSAGSSEETSSETTELDNRSM